MNIAATLSLLIMSGLFALPAYSGDESSQTGKTETVKAASQPDQASKKPVNETSKAAVSENASPQEPINPMVQFCRENPC